jgi:excisionase family DNA binding protein
VDPSARLIYFPAMPNYASDDQQIDPQAAADLLNVPRTYVTMLLESGRIPHIDNGSDVRIPLADVLAFKARLDAEAERAFADLVQQGQELSLGYD